MVLAYDDDVSRLRTELERIKQNVDLISKETGIDNEGIEFRVDNALAAIQVVEKNLDKAGIMIG